MFAPTDAAFRSLADQLKMPLEELMNSPILVPIVLNHIVGYKVWVSLVICPSIVIESMDSDKDAQQVTLNR